jgi:arylsulfatase A-like enzyme
VLNYFVLEDGIDFLLDQLIQIPQPFLGYFHFLPPHKPFSPRREFTELFTGDGFKPPKKPEHLFSMGISYEESLRVRRAYNQNIAYVDAEFARLFTFMENSGLLENTWLVFTSDHGEMFERGIIGHNIENLHEPTVKVPLVIFEPGQTTRRDIFTLTSCIDILPTLLHVTSQSIPEWVEGEILPPYRESEPNPDRNVFSIQPRYNSVSKVLTRASVMMVKDQYKLHSYFGYDKLPSNETLYELYDLENDPEELDNIYSNKLSLARVLQNELKEKLDEVDEPFL